MNISLLESLVLVRTFPSSHGSLELANKEGAECCYGLSIAGYSKHLHAIDH